MPCQPTALRCVVRDIGFFLDFSNTISVSCRPRAEKRGDFPDTEEGKMGKRDNVYNDVS